MRLALAGALILFLSACGSTSGIRSSGLEGQGGPALSQDVSKYDTVAVLNFRDATGESKASADGGDKKFADLIA